MFFGSYYCVSLTCHSDVSVTEVHELRPAIFSLTCSLLIADIFPNYQFEVRLSLSVLGKSSFSFATNLLCYYSTGC